MVNTPGMIALSDVLQEWRGDLFKLLNEGLREEHEKPLRFLVLVPGVGACQVPRLALSHLQARQPHYVAKNLREWWSGQPVPEWTITTDALWICEDDWNKRMGELAELRQALERIPVRIELGFQLVEEVASLIACAVLGLPADPALYRNGQPTPTGERFTQQWHDWMALLLRLVTEEKLTLRNREGLEFPGPFDEGYLSTAELDYNEALFTLPAQSGMQYARRIRFELHKPGFALRTRLDAGGMATTSWEPVEESVLAPAAVTPSEASPQAALHGGKETKSQRRRRRYDRYASLGGGFDEDEDGSWRLTGGSFDALRRDEIAAGRDGLSEKTIRDDLKRAHAEVLKAQREGDKTPGGTGSTWADQLLKGGR